jgi:hypothetical protein
LSTKIYGFTSQKTVMLIGTYLRTYIVLFTYVSRCTQAESRPQNILSRFFANHLSFNFSVQEKSTDILKIRLQKFKFICGLTALNILNIAVF